jgi:hypothetical protein
VDGKLGGVGEGGCRMGESRDGLGRYATKLSTLRLAAMEAAEQAQKLRVVGGELSGVGEESYQRRENIGMAWGETVGGGGGGGIGWKKK